MVQQTVEAWSGGGFGVDLGGWYEVSPTIRVGASVANLGGPNITLRNVAETHPVLIRGGVSAQVLGGRGLVTAEVDQSNGLGPRLHGGGEYWIQPTFALPIGLGDTHATG